ncbi:MAG: 2OG-Fe(II) oxygenase [Lysobacterales bacterium]
MPRATGNGGSSGTLNERHASGGDTAFCDPAAAPRAGRLLMFPPYWMFQHAGLPPVSGNKYILSTYLLF